MQTTDEFNFENFNKEAIKGIYPGKPFNGVQTSPNVILSKRLGVRQFSSSKSPSSPSPKMFLVKLKQRGFKLNNIHNGRQHKIYTF